MVPVCLHLNTRTSLLRETRQTQRVVVRKVPTLKDQRRRSEHAHGLCASTHWLERFWRNNEREIAEWVRMRTATRRLSYIVSQVKVKITQLFKLCDHNTGGPSTLTIF
jgi:hypothetical protein